MKGKETEGKRMEMKQLLTKELKIFNILLSERIAELEGDKMFTRDEDKYLELKRIKSKVECMLDLEDERRRRLNDGEIV